MDFTCLPMCLHSIESTKGEFFLVEFPLIRDNPIEG